MRDWYSNQLREITMSYYVANIPVRNFETNQVRTVPLKAETVSALLVHRDHDGRGWVVSTRGGIALYGAPDYTTNPLKTRREARAVARYLAPFLPDEVKRGRWDANEWAKHDGGFGLATFQEAQRYAWTRGRG